MNSPTIEDAWQRRRNNFHLIRLVAAWMVIYGHAWAITGSGGQDLVTWLTRYKFAGAVAVDVFFVISGFLVAGSVQRHGRLEYLAARALRILPALAACVLLTVFVLGPLLTVAGVYWRNPQTWRYLLNATLWSAPMELPGVFQSLPYKTVNGSLWTLPIEGRLYVALLVAAVAGVLTPRRYTPLWLLALAAAYVWVLRRPGLPEQLVTYAWLTAFFITGTALWLHRARIRLDGRVVLGLLAAAAAGRGHAWFHVPYFALICYGTLWVALVPRLPRIEHTDLSYGMYLYGWPMAQLAQSWWPGGPLHNMLLATCGATACAAGSWFLIERPALSLKRKMFAAAPPVAALS